MADIHQGSEPAILTKLFSLLPFASPTQTSVRIACSRASMRRFDSFDDEFRRRLVLHVGSSLTEQLNSFRAASHVSNYVSERSFTPLAKDLYRHNVRFIELPIVLHTTSRWQLAGSKKAIQSANARINGEAFGIIAAGLSNDVSRDWLSNEALVGEEFWGHWASDLRQKEAQKSTSLCHNSSKSEQLKFVNSAQNIQNRAEKMGHRKSTFGQIPRDLNFSISDSQRADVEVRLKNSLQQIAELEKSRKENPVGKRRKKTELEVLGIVDT